MLLWKILITVLFSWLIILCCVQAVTLPKESVVILPKENEIFINNSTYTSDIARTFRRLKKEFPQMAKSYKIGKSIGGRDLLVIQINKNIYKQDRLTPMVKLIANMHGDESIGRELLIYLAKFLLLNYGIIDEVTTLLDQTDIHIMPSMNPDGFQSSREGNCNSLSNKTGRLNAAGIDLNRDFPSRFKNFETLESTLLNRQPETSAIIKWIASNPFVLSANFHGGALVANYPFDNTIENENCCVHSPTPDDRLFKTIAYTYAQNHPRMKWGTDCGEYFPNGITNGAYWYELNGGMQDFNYVFSNCFEITIELSCCKYPLPSTLPDEWYKNKRSLLEFIKLAHIGVKGYVKDIYGKPITYAEIIVQGIEGKSIRTTKHGAYWRLLLPGVYRIQAKAFGYESSSLEIIRILEKGTSRLDFNLKETTEVYGISANYHSFYLHN